MLGDISHGTSRPTDLPDRSQWGGTLWRVFGRPEDVLPSLLIGGWAYYSGSAVKQPTVVNCHYTIAGTRIVQVMPE